MCVCLHRDTDIDSDRSDKAPREERKQKDNKKKEARAGFAGDGLQLMVPGWCCMHDILVLHGPAAFGLHSSMQ